MIFYHAITLLHTISDNKIATQYILKLRMSSYGRGEDRLSHCNPQFCSTASLQAEPTAVLAARTVANVIITVIVTSSR